MIIFLHGRGKEGHILDLDPLQTSEHQTDDCVFQSFLLIPTGDKSAAAMKDYCAGPQVTVTSRGTSLSALARRTNACAKWSAAPPYSREADSLKGAGIFLQEEEGSESPTKAPKGSHS